MKEQVELWHCPYLARCRAATLPYLRGCRRCPVRAAVIVRYVDNQGRALRQVEVCERHAGEIVKCGLMVRDMR